MGVIKFTIADDVKFERDLEANCRHHGYNEEVNDENGIKIPNPQSKEDFMEDYFKKNWRETSKAQRIREAVEALSIEE